MTPDPGSRARAAYGVTLGTVPRHPTAVLAAAVCLGITACAGSGQTGGTPPAAAGASPTGTSTAAGTSTPSGTSTPAGTSTPEPAGPSCPTAASLPLRARIAQTLFLGVDGSSDAAVRELVEAEHPAGGIFVGGDATQVLTSGVLQEAASVEPAPLVAVDDEGGRVQRFEALAGALPDARELGLEEPAQIRALAEDRGRRLAEAGVTMNFAPVVDLGGQPDDEVIGDRAFGETPQDVERAAGAFADGLRAAGILPTLKHFPGHGRAVGDSHLGQATTPPWSQLQPDLSPYRTLTQQQPVAVMVGHLTVPGLSSEGTPASLDPAVYAALREEVGFRGLAVTDDLSAMRAVSAQFDQAEAVRLALAAGADMALLVAPDGLDTLLDALEADVSAGDLSAERVTAAADAVLSAKGC